MSFSHEYNFPVFLTNGSVLSSGHSSTLAPAQLGVFVDKTHNVLAGSAVQDQALRIIQGSLHTKDKFNQYYGGVRKSDESPAFLTSGILSFEKSLPRVARSETWVLGWDGVSTTDTLSFECGKHYRFFVKVWGQDVYGTFLRPVQREIGFQTDCCDSDDCTQACQDGIPCKLNAKKLAAAINADPELKYFVLAEAITSDAVDHAATHRYYCVSACDAGTVLDLSAVQVQAGLDQDSVQYSVERFSRNGTISTYRTVTKLDGPDGSPLDTPGAFTPTGTILLEDCGVCPAGYTTVGGFDFYSVVRPLAGTEDLTTSGARQTYADVIGTAYKAADVATIATTDVNTGTEVITETAHNFVTGQAVVYDDGGSTAITGLVDNTTYYVIKVSANTFKVASTVALAFAGTAINLTGTGNNAQSFTPVITATFLSHDEAGATVQLKVAHGVTISALVSDSLSLNREVAANCTPAAASLISWEACGDVYRTTRTLHMTVEKDCGLNNRLADIVAFYAGVATVASTPSVSTAGTCSDIYVITQYSDNLLVDGCLSEGVPVYTELPSFEGFTWTANADTDSEDSVKCGVRITTAYEDTKFGGCSFHPNDYYSVRPLSLEVTALVGGPGDSSVSPCEAIMPSRKIQYSSMPTQSGEWMIREFINANKYRINGEYWTDPRMREVLDTVGTDIIDRTKFYTVYYFKVKAFRQVQNHQGDFSPEIYEFRFGVPQGTDVSTLETTLSGLAAQNGVFLKDR